MKKSIQIAQGTNKALMAVCRYPSGNSFDCEEGDIVEVDILYITRVSRGGKDLDLSDAKKWGYLRSQQEIRGIIEAGDYIEDNYCHGVYEAI